MDVRRNLFSETHLLFFFFFAFENLWIVGAVRFINVIDYGAKPDGVTDSSQVCAN